MENISNFVSWRLDCPLRVDSKQSLVTDYIQRKKVTSVRVHPTVRQQQQQQQQQKVMD